MQVNGTADRKHSKEINNVINTSTNLREACAVFNKRVEDFLHVEQPTELLKNVQEQTKITLEVFAHALQKYRLDQLSIAYNGGKDCLVLLVIYLVGLHKHFNQHPTVSQRFPGHLEAVYIQSAHPFDEVSSFVYSSAQDYRLSVTTSTAPMKQAFTDYLQVHPNVQAIFVGTRRTDPHGAKLTHFDNTDGGWPKFMRVQPVIDWHYQEIWAFIKYFDIPYCPLYDLGYTSLGGMKDTHPNPRLRREENGIVRYAPASELLEDSEERLGRDR